MSAEEVVIKPKALEKRLERPTDNTIEGTANGCEEPAVARIQSVNVTLIMLTTTESVI